MRKILPLSTKAIQTIALGTFCAIGAFAAGIETAGDVHPFAKSEAALQEMLVSDADLRGDVDGNGRIDDSDAYRLYQIAQGLEEPTIEETRRGDSDGDGRITAKDLGIVLHRLSLH